MTDFISGLLDRAMERTPLLRRRCPAMFEPTIRVPQSNLFQHQSVAKKDFEEIESLRETADVYDMHRIHTSPRKSPSPSIEARPFRTSVAQDDGERIIVETKPLTPIRQSDTDDKRTVEVAARADESERPLANSAAAVPPRPKEGIHELTGDKSSSRVPSPLVRRLDVPSIEVKPVMPIVSPRVMTARNSQRQDIRTNPPVLAQMHENEPVMTKPVKPSLQPSNVPLPRLRLPGRRSHPEMAHQTESLAPIVQVSIGRIEVRAVQPASPTARNSRLAPPKLNLEDYLRSRSGGDR